LIIVSFLKRVWNDLIKAQRYWPFLLPGAISLAYLAGLGFLTNSYGVYALQKQVLSLILVPLVYIALSFITGYFFIPQQEKMILLPIREVSLFKNERDSFLNRLASFFREVIRGWKGLFLWSAAVATAFFFIFPNSLPLLTQNHTLKILATGSQNKGSKGTIVEIRQLKSMDGHTFPWEKLKLAGDWQVIENELFSLKGGPDTVAEFSGPVPGGMVLSLRYMEDAGQVMVIWDGVKKDLDLYTIPGIIKDDELSGFSWSQTTFWEATWILLTNLFYFTGLFSLTLVFSLFIRLRVVGRHLGSVLMAITFAIIYILFLKGKFSYSEFNGIQPYFDSRSYMEVADLPLTAPEFWAGQRAFTLPLFYKLLDVHLADDWSHAMMGKVSSTQIWLSIGCWTVLAFALVLRTRQRWLKPFAFGIMLLFGLNLEIGIWDRLMLSESLSFSLFALLIAVWLLWGVLPEKMDWVGKSLFLIGVILLTVLYSFLRDTHVYFLLIVAAVIGAGVACKKIEAGWRKYYLAYVIVIVILAFVQNLSLAVGKRWEVPAYNSLVQWILPDDRARDFFVQHGLPVSEKLMKISQLSVVQYTEMIQQDPELAPAKQWIEQNWRSTYLGYLLANLGDSLAAPIREISTLLDDGALRYHSPIFPARPFSDDMLWVTRLAYVRSPWIEGLAAILLLIGCAVYWFQKTPGNSIGWVLSVLIVSIYPLMFIVWHADPAEPQRHALQIGIQFRVAGWMGLVLGIDWITRKIFER
jgi:hypothetical protein